MEVLLHGYEVNRPTWFYLSTLLILAVFFRFNRLWSLRNIDLMLLLAGSPGLMFVQAQSAQTRQFGQIWLFAVAGLLLLRLCFDSWLQRRPYLGQNLNIQGLAFLCCASFAFLMTQAITHAPTPSSAEVFSRADSLLGVYNGEPDSVPAAKRTSDPVQTKAPLNSKTSAGDSALSSTQSPTEARVGGTNGPERERNSDLPAVSDSAENSPQVVTAGPAAPVLAAGATYFFEDLAARVLAIFSHAAVITGLWFVGRNLFGDAGHGLAMATLYLLLPCTAYNVGEFNHVLPSALIVWGVVCFRKPVIAGILLGLACGTMLFPVVLLPIWLVFYGRKGALRFGTALFGVGALLFASLVYLTGDRELFLREALAPVNLAFLDVTRLDTAQAGWRSADFLSLYRLPVMVAYGIMLITMTIWPRQRTVETLLSQSAAAILGTQLWYTERAGVYLLWYVPLLLIVIFRPRLAHLVPVQPASEADAAASSPRASGTTRSGVVSSQRLQLFR